MVWLIWDTTFSQLESLLIRTVDTYSKYFSAKVSVHVIKNQFDFVCFNGNVSVLI